MFAYVNRAKKFASEQEPPAVLSQSQKFMASLALILSVVAVLLVVAMRTTPCANAQSGSCAVGDTEVFASNITVNEDSNDADTRMEGDTNANLFYLDAGNDRIGLGTASPAVFFDVQGITSFSAAVNLAATQRIFFDGGADTSIFEQAADDLHVVVGGTAMLQIDQDLGTNSYGNLAPTDIWGHHMGGAFTSGGSSNRVSTLTVAGNTTAITGDTEHLAQISAGAATGGSIILMDNSETIAVVTTVYLTEPNIIVGGASDTVTRANVLTIATVPTEATAGGNNSIYMPVGAFEVSDGQGAAGEQLTSGGQDAALTWTAAASDRSSKTNIVERIDYEAALAAMVSAPVYDFKYKPPQTFQSLNEEGESITHIDASASTPSTGDFATVYAGIMADEAPWAMHYDGTILNPVSTFGYTVMSFKEVVSMIDELQFQIDALEARLLVLESK